MFHESLSKKSGFKEADLGEHFTLLIAASLAAIAGAFIGNKLLTKITLRFYCFRQVSIGKRAVTVNR